MVDHPLPAPPEASAFSVRAMTLLASGRSAALRTLLASQDAGRSGGDELLAAVIDADLGVRNFEVGLAQIDGLVRRVEREGADRPHLRWWLQAMLAERFLYESDVEAVVVAASMLPELPTGPIERLEVLYARGRLRRIASVLYLLSPSPENHQLQRRMRDDAINDFLRCGFGDEAAVTRALSATAEAFDAEGDLRDNLARVVDARAEIAERQSSAFWVAALDYAIAILALLIGDLATVHRSIDEMEAILHGADTADADAGASFRRMLLAHVTFIRAFTTMIGTRGSDESVAAVERAIEPFRTINARVVQQQRNQVAHALYDLGHPAARRFAMLTLDLPPNDPADSLNVELLRIRTDALAGVVPQASDVKRILQQLETLGHRRRAGGMALRMARDLKRLESYADAWALHTWGLERIPAAPNRTLWEAAAARPVDGPPTAARPERAAKAPFDPDHAALEIRVLTPQLDLRTPAGPRVVSDTAAKLLLLLLWAHPDPVHVEQAAEVLWPDATIEVSRGRLNTVVYRVRSALGSTEHGLRRSRDLLGFDATGCDVDLLAYRDAWRTGTDAERVAALLSPTGNLCHVQFPYDESLIDARHAFVADWTRQAADLVRQGVVNTEQLQPLLARLDLTADHLTG